MLLDAVYVTSFKPCMVKTYTDLYTFIVVLVTLTDCEVHNLEK